MCIPLNDNFNIPSLALHRYEEASIARCAEEFIKIVSNFFFKSFTEFRAINTWIIMLLSKMWGKLELNMQGQCCFWKDLHVWGGPDKCWTEFWPAIHWESRAHPPGCAYKWHTYFIFNLAFGGVFCVFFLKLALKRKLYWWSSSGWVTMIGRGAVWVFCGVYTSGPAAIHLNMNGSRVNGYWEGRSCC